MPTRVLESIELRQLRLPLTKPYRLAIGVQTDFNTVLVTLTTSDGARGFGEATLVPGYTDETVEASWARAGELAEVLAGGTVEAARDELWAAWPEAPFTATAFLSALDCLEAHPALTRPANVPLLAILSSDGRDYGSARDEADRLVETGYRTLKFKVGFDLESDLAALQTVQKAVDGRAGLRVDANQGFSQEDAIAFLDAMSPEGIELVEQTCDKADWDAAVAVKPHGRVPLMLDESIYGPDDIDRAAALGAADLVKLKLMKVGDLTALQSALDRIRSNGMTPVLGNGVATDIGCWMEACAMPGHVDNAGEMNGFLKTPVQLLDPPIRMEGDEIVLPEDLPGLNQDAVDKVTVRLQRWG
ncbi:MAG: mandelate racemase/muconate lactonizing enzyme family protein [Methyloligellaceae bacterium]